MAEAITEKTQNGNLIPSDCKTPKKSVTPLKVILFVILVLFVISLLLPLLWGVSTSLKGYYDYRANKLGLPKGAPWEWKWSNFAYVITHYSAPAVTGSGVAINVSMGKQVVNTLLFAGVGGLVATFTPFLVAYLTARYDYVFSKIIYAVVLITMILPIVGSFPSELALLRALGMYDQIWGSWIQKMSFLGVYYLLFYAAFKGINKEFWEAAYIDGASEFTVMARIIMPLARNVFFTVFLIKFIEFWNDYQTVLLYLPGHPMLAYGVYKFGNSNDPNLNTVPMRMAGCMVLVLPMIAIFLIFKDKLIENISVGGVKG